MASGTSRDVLGRGLRVLGQAIREQPRIFAVAVAGSVLFGLMVIASAFVVGGVVGEVAAPAIARGSVAGGTLALAAAALFGISVLRVVGIFGRRLGAGYMQYRLQADYRRRVTRRYLDLPLSWHHRNATGTLLSNANSDVEAAWYPIAPLPFAVGTLVMLVGAVVALFLTDWALALVGLAVFPALFALNVVYSRRMAPRQARAQRLRAEVSGIAHESFDGALVVKTMGREAQETARFAARAGELRDALIAVGRLRGVFDPMLETLPSLGTLAVLVVGVLRLRQGAIEVTELVSVAFLFTVLAFPVRAIGWVLAELPRSVAGWDRVRRVLDATSEMPYGEVTLDPAAPTPATLAFHDVHFGYEPAEAHLPGTEVLGEVTFTVPAGKTVALVGATGAGKSTIASLALRLVDPRAGRVTLDGVDLRELSAASLAANVALVAQVPFVFDDTVRANITLDRPGVGDEEVWAALRLAEADGFVAALPNGLDTMVGERGTSLSGGQRQRLTLARALAGRPRLLVLDDATSAVDPRVEAAILAGLRAADSAAPASILVVAYRRATIALADEVIYVEQGRVVARGTHADLLATVPGYADLVTAYEQAEQEREQSRPYDEVSPPLTSGLEVEVDR
ncbi:ABC-type multidrug transport system, ATPase and permease component [Micromonospora viridifaciens]|uniref:ABC-type multidrug transport system, ATPase and permease component n=1 Tax=Micromonospora viridifaciens TaxID=1881 RepID=A0A1C4W420_MICVI|nr:ABC transporter ATP-binding protein [Micromonospora viridifaciens]SCE90987.1 ABC-type multidrug transport system, ATPase and permease component [Micromonospora viridifaciens]